MKETEITSTVIGNVGIKGHDTSPNSTQLLSLVGTSWCMCHRFLILVISPTDWSG